MTEQAPLPDSTLRRTALVAVVLLVVGVTLFSVGMSLAFGVPAGLIALGTLLIGGGVLLGITT
jgi:hypothetical protein